MTRPMMYLCAPNPHASARDGMKASTAASRLTAMTRVRIGVLYLRDQAAERAQVASVPWIQIALAPALRSIQLRRLEQHRQLAKPRIVEQPPERLQADTSLADVFVAV